MKPEMVEEVISILSGLRQAFAQIMPSVDGVASLTQQGVTSEASAPPLAVEPVGAMPAGAEAKASSAPGAETQETPAPEPAPEPAMTGPVNPVRFRAANAYATSR